MRLTGTLIPRFAIYPASPSIHQPARKRLHSSNMLGAKAVTLALCVVLSLGQATADRASHLRVRVYDKSDTPAHETTSSNGCADGEQTIAVLGWDHDGCIGSDNVCVADVSDGDCPDGAYCAFLLDTGVFGCAAGEEPTEDYSGADDSFDVSVGNYKLYGSGDDDGTCDDGEQTIGVIGWDHDGCIASDNVCAAAVSDGDCPAGAHCYLLDTGVFGCMSKTHKKHHKKHHHKSTTTCPSGQQTIGVEGWSQDGCVATGNVCVADVDGDCPTGAYCDVLDTGVYGCKDGAPPTETTSWTGCSGSEQTIGVVGWDHDGCIDSDYVCAADVSDGDCPAGAYCDLLDTGVWGCVSA